MIEPFIQKGVHHHERERSGVLQGLFASLAPKARSTRSRTSCSASRAAARAATPCATRSRRHDPGPKRKAIVEDLLGGRTTPHHPAREHGGRPRPRSHIRRSSSSSYSAPASEETEVAECARRRDHRDQRARLAARHRQRDRQAVNLKVVVDPRFSGDRRHGRRHSHRRQRRTRSRSVEGRL